MEGKARMENDFLNKLLDYPAPSWAPNGLHATPSQLTRRLYDWAAPVYGITTNFFHSNAHRRARSWRAMPSDTALAHNALDTALAHNALCFVAVEARARSLRHARAR
jgi:hypothetical protein